MLPVLNITVILMLIDMEIQKKLKTNKKKGVFFPCKYIKKDLYVWYYNNFTLALYK